MDDFEMSILKRAFSEKLVIPEGMTDVKTQQKDDLISIVKGLPLFLRDWRLFCDRNENL